MHGQQSEHLAAIRFDRLGMRFNSHSFANFSVASNLGVRLTLDIDATNPTAANGS
jgi:hypothetical protein